MGTLRSIHTKEWETADMKVSRVGGDFAGNRPLISPAAYRCSIAPEVRAVTEAAHAAGMRAVNASDGNLWSVIEDSLDGCGVDGSLEIDAQAGVDLGRLKRRFGGSGDGRLPRRAPVLRSDAITASVPPANYRALIDEYRRFFGLPPLSL